MNALVSVIIPYYNRPKKLQRCIQSVQAQSYQPIEIIVVDDASTIPPTHLSPEVIYLRNEVNSGPGVSRNKGKQLAKGTYISFLDSDDYWHQDFLKHTVSQLASNEAIGMVYANGQTVNEAEEIIEFRRGKKWEVQQIIPHILLHGRPWGTGACVWKRKVIDTIDWLPTRSWEDYAFDISAGLMCNTVGVVMEPLVFYDVSGSDQLSKQEQDMAVIQKGASLLHISQLLATSAFHDNEKVRHAMQIQLLNNMIAEHRYGSNTKHLKNIPLNELKNWLGRGMIWQLQLFLALPSKAALRGLIYFRNKLNKRHVNG